MIQIVLWLVVILVLVWLLLNYIIRFVDTIWEIFVPFIDTKLINLRSKFGEWAVITGSTDGIGKAYAIELATRGMNLVLISRTLEKLERTKNEILKDNPTIEVKIIVADFSKGKEIYGKLAEELKDIPVGILVNNVGIMYSYPMYLGEVEEDYLWDMINVNIGATTLMTRLIIGKMQARGKGAIVNLSSGSALQPLPLMAVYAASKVYIKSFTDAIRAEYSRFGITVQHLAPFFVSTKMNAYSNRLQVSTFVVPDAMTYAKHAVNTLGKIDSTSGYWSHSVQKIFTLSVPEMIRTRIGLFLNQCFRRDYFNRKETN